MRTRKEHSLSCIKVNYFLIPLRAGFDAEQPVWISDRGSANMGVLILAVNAIAQTFIDWDFLDMTFRHAISRARHSKMNKFQRNLRSQFTKALFPYRSTVRYDWHELDTYLTYPSYICDKFKAWNNYLTAINDERVQSLGFFKN